MDHFEPKRYSDKGAIGSWEPLLSPLGGSLNLNTIIKEEQSLQILTYYCLNHGRGPFHTA